MLSEAIPNRAHLRAETLCCLKRGITDSSAMRQDIAHRLNLDARHSTFINNHAWSLVDLQSQGLIKRMERGVYALSNEPALPDVTIEPPLDGVVPSWARSMIGKANNQNAKRFPGTEPFTTEDLMDLWRQCDGKCAMSGLAYSGERIGSGKARRPYFPSLDRIDPEQPYTRRNCRLVLQAVNFGLNAFGDEVYLRIARATAQRNRN